MEERGLENHAVFECIGREGLRLDALHILELSTLMLRAFIAGQSAPLSDEEITVGVLDDPRTIGAGDICVAFSADYLDGKDDVLKYLPQREYGDPVSGFIDHEPLLGLDYVRVLFDHAWLGAFEAKSRSLRRIGETALAMDLVSLAMGHRSAGTSHALKFDFLRYDVSIDPTDEGLLQAENTDFFDGLWSVCSCGDWGDSSDFIWVWGRVPIVYMSTQCGGWIDGLQILPRRLTDDVVARRRAERELIGSRISRWEKR